MAVLRKRISGQNSIFICWIIWKQKSRGRRVLQVTAVSSGTQIVINQKANVLKHVDKIKQLASGNQKWVSSCTVELPGFLISRWGNPFLARNKKKKTSGHQTGKSDRGDSFLTNGLLMKMFHINPADCEIMDGSYRVSGGPYEQQIDGNWIKHGGWKGPTQDGWWLSFTHAHKVNRWK